VRWNQTACLTVHAWAVFYPVGCISVVQCCHLLFCVGETCLKSNEHSLYRYILLRWSTVMSGIFFCYRI